MTITERLRASLQTTPGIYRALSVVVAVALVLAALAATVAAATAEAATARLRDNTGPVLVATQSLLASLAEADAAATAAFLSGPEEDREQRRLYEEALARANVQSEEISALIGDDAAAHADLKNLSIRVTRYAGLVEAARATKRAGVAGGEQYLLAALDLLATGVRQDAAQLTETSERRLEREEARRGSRVVLALAVGVIASGALVAAQVMLARRSRRLVNPPLALSTVALVAALLWLGVADARSGADLRRGREQAYEAIALTASIQRQAFGSKADESVALIASDAGRRAQADEAAAQVHPAPVGAELVEAIRAGRVPAGGGLLLTAAREADSPRERAAIAEVFVRWQRYVDTVAVLRAAPPAEATSVAVGPASAAFNGFNFSVESVLAGNRDQFFAALAAADNHTRGLRVAMLALPLLAAIAALGGFQLRIGEYR